MRIIVDAGHFLKDPGAVYAGYTERDLCINIRNELNKLYPSIIFVPDELDLTQTINWINSFCNPDDLCISIHLNANKDTSRRGCEAYFSDVSYLADIFSKQISKSLDVPNGGSRPDYTTYVGSLGWLRKIKGQNVLIECCYLTNPLDRSKLLLPGGFRKAAEGILAGISEHLGNLSILEQLKQIINKLLKLIK